MVTTVQEAPRGFVGHLWTWVQAVGLVYVVGFGMVLLGSSVTLVVRGAIELVSWTVGLAR
jgi:hypothetical protein